MKIYVLIANDDGYQSFDLPSFGRKIRAYTNKKVAQNMAKKFNCYAIELDLTDGEII